MISISDLTVSFGGFTLLDTINFHISDKEKVGLVGKNGAGKSTTLKMLTGLLKPKSGHILLDGQDIWAKGNESIRKQIGYVPDQPILYFRLTAKEHLYYNGLFLWQNLTWQNLLEQSYSRQSNPKSTC